MIACLVNRNTQHRAAILTSQTCVTELLHEMSIRQGQMTQAIDPDTFKPAGAPVNNREMMDYNPVTAEM